jgi:hypothetical protein
LSIIYLFLASNIEEKEKKEGKKGDNSKVGNKKESKIGKVGDGARTAKNRV